MAKCYGCFRDKPDGQEICPFCGYNPSEAKGKYPAALPEGTVLAGRYIVGRVLGQGGFGITYIAEDYKTKEIVAIKEYFPETLALRLDGRTLSSYSDERMESFEYGKKCFLEEADTLSKFIDNNNICRILSYFEENGTAYFAMEYLDGESMLDYIKRQGGRISFEDSKRILFPIMDALSAVHSKGIIHRDISPDNIIIEKNGSVKLLDFGAARYSLGDRSRSLDVVLKHGYAPKEQYTRHGKQGPFTDIYSLAATYYKAITGRTPPDSIDRIEDDNLVEPSTFGVSISREAEDALMTALAVNPSDRFRSMADFKASLEGKAPSYPQQTTGIPTQTGYPQNTGYQTQTGYPQNTGFGNTAFPGQEMPPRPAFGKVQPPPIPATPQGAQPAKKNWILPVALASVAAVVIIAVALIIVLAGRNNTPVPAPEASSSSSPSSFDYGSSAPAVETEAEAAMVKMTSYQGMSYDDAKKQLEDMGFTVKEEKVYSDSVEKSKIISQSIEEGELVMMPSEITLTVSRGREHSKDGYDQKVVVTASSGSYTGTLALYNWEEGEWVEKLNCGCCVGDNGITSNYGEGIKATPKGEYKLGVVISANTVDTKMNTYRATYDTCIIDDTGSSLYNTIQTVGSFPSSTHYDRIGDGLTNGECYAQVFIEHNGDGFSSAPSSTAGSAITICGMNTSLHSTWGCIDIVADNMKKLLKALDPALDPHIVTQN